MPHYRKHGKILSPLSDEQFKQKMNTGHFVKKSHKAFVVLLWYSAVRKAEALRALKEQFTIERTTLFFSVGKRLKHGKETQSLELPLDLPFIYELEKAIGETRKGKRVFPFCERTAYNIVDRIGFYPHYFRLSRITNFFLEGWDIASVLSWTGLTLNALNFYVERVKISEMGRSLSKKPRVNH